MIRAASVARPDLRWPFPAGLAERLAGARVEGFRRRGKYMLMRLSGGDSVLIHLGMSGRMVARRGGGRDAVGDAPPTPARAPGAGDRRRASASASSTRAASAAWTWCRPRRRTRTGCWRASGRSRWSRASRPRCSPPRCAGKRTPIKAALLDQKVVAGLGNIYVSEALFRARISPRRARRRASPGTRAARLVPAIRAVLEESIAAGGSSLAGLCPGRWRDRLLPGTVQGLWPRGAALRGMPGRRPACPGIRRIVQAGRATFHCPRLQR